MDQKCIDILEIFLQSSRPLNYHEVESDIETGKKWEKQTGKKGEKLKSNSIRVTVVGKLKVLTDEGYLNRENKGHKDVRYSFKNESAREKAKLVVQTSQTSAFEWEKTLSAALRWSIPREGGLHETVEPIVLIIPGAMLSGYFYRIVDAVIQNNPDDLAFYQKQAMVTLGLYWDSLIKAVRKEPRKQLREVLDIANRNGETHLLPTNESELRELFNKKFKTSGNHETPPDSKGEKE